jgi:serine/threonine-protein kinase
MIEPGTVVGGRYRVARIIGPGGMGVVVVATHVQLDQRVAINVLDDSVAHDPEFVERFVREARATASLHGGHAAG